MKEKEIDKLLKEMNKKNDNFFDNGWLFIVFLLIFSGFSNNKKEETTPIININIKGDK